MKRLIILFSVLILCIAAFLVMGATNVKAADNVVFVSANGTGDGSSPDKPIGNAADYKPATVGSEPGNAFYRALERIKSTGGTMVVVGDVFLDSAHSRVPTSKTDKKVPSEFDLPGFKSNCKVTITSVYNGVDYRKNGATLVLDHDVCNTGMLVFSFPTIFKDVNIEYRYDPTSTNKWEVPYVIGGGGYAITVDTGVKVTSYDAKNKKDGDVFPILIGGARYDNSINNTNVTVKSGTWSAVIAGSYGMVDNTPDRGTVKNNATLVIEGGKIETVVGTGSLDMPSGTVLGKLDMTIKGGEIEEVYVTNDHAFTGKSANITIEKNAKILNFMYTTPKYLGNLTELVLKVSIKNDSKLVITPPVEIPDDIETTGPSETDRPATETKPTVTKPMVTRPVTPEDNRPLEQVIEEDFIHPKVFLGVVLAWALIGIGFGVRYLLKKVTVKKK